MEQPGYTDITQIVKLHDLVEVNDQLARGWRLLSVRTERTADDQQQTMPRATWYSNVSTKTAPVYSFGAATRTPHHLHCKPTTYGRARPICRGYAITT